MQTKPVLWTHHHTHRIYHISLGMCFSFVAVTVLWGSTLAWWQAKADNVSLSARVNTINPGTTVALGSSSTPFVPQAPETPALPQPNLTAPTISIIQDAAVPSSALQEISLPDGKKTKAYVYTTLYPQFSGRTNIPNALVFLEVHSEQLLRATTVADAAGQWQWVSPTRIVAGFHTLTVRAQDQNDSRITATSTLNFFVKGGSNTPEAEPALQGLEAAPGNKVNLFDIFVKIPAKFKEFPAGDDVIVQIKLINFGSAGNPVDVPVQYTIEDNDHKVIMETKETVAVATQLSLLKTFHTSPTLSDGTYTIIARVPTTDAIALASDSFIIKGAPVVALSDSARVDFTVVFQALIALFFLFAIITYFEYNRAVDLSLIIKRASEDDLKRLR